MYHLINENEMYAKTNNVGGENSSENTKDKFQFDQEYFEFEVEPPT